MNHYLNQIDDIRNMMERSSRFISLSGLSGVLAGVFGLIGSILVSIHVSGFEISPLDFSQQGFAGIAEQLYAHHYIIMIAVLTLLFSVFTSIVFTMSKAKRNQYQIWDRVAKKMVLSLATPVFFGGLFILALLGVNLPHFMPGVSLLFYGMGLLMASRYTWGEIYYLGLVEMILGIGACFFFEFGLIFWGLGFGIMHIIYGIWLYIKYDRKPHA